MAHGPSFADPIYVALTNVSNSFLNLFFIKFIFSAKVTPNIISFCYGLDIIHMKVARL